MYTLSFLDVKTLLQKETVSKSWRKISKKAIPRKAFQSKEELKVAIWKYCRCEDASMEEIAGTKGYPIDNWDVSQVTDMANLFEYMNSLNEKGWSKVLQPRNKNLGYVKCNRYE
jgi:hypothetical protein